MTVTERLGVAYASSERVYIRAPTRADTAEFTALMRASREFHSPWATAPTSSSRTVIRRVFPGYGVAHAAVRG